MLPFLSASRGQHYVPHEFNSCVSGLKDLSDPFPSHCLQVLEACSLLIGNSSSHLGMKPEQTGFGWVSCVRVEGGQGQRFNPVRLWTSNIILPKAIFGFI